MFPHIDKVGTLSAMETAKARKLPGCANINDNNVSECLLQACVTLKSQLDSDVREKARIDQEWDAIAKRNEAALRLMPDYLPKEVLRATANAARITLQNCIDSRAISQPLAQRLEGLLIGYGDNLMRRALQSSDDGNRPCLAVQVFEALSTSCSMPRLNLQPGPQPAPATQAGGTERSPAGRCS